MIKPPLNVAAAGRLASSLRLSDIVCLGIEAKFLAPDPEAVEGVLAWDNPPSQVVWDIEGESLKVVLPMDLFISTHPAESPAEKRKVAEIGLVWRIEYRIVRTDAWSEDDVPHYVGVSSYLHAWPYFRAEVQSLSTKLGFPPLVLPVIVSGYPAKKVTVVNLAELKSPPALPRRKGKKGSVEKEPEKP